MIQPPNTRPTPTPTTSTCHPYIRGHHAVCKTRRHITTTIPLQEKVHPRSDRHLPLLRLRSRLHHAHSTVGHCISPCQAYGRNHARCKQFLDYTATHQDTILTYKASDMVLVVHSDESYLSKPKAHSRAGGHFFLSSDCDDPADNGTVQNLAQLIKAVMSSAAEAELGALYINAREAVPQ